MTANALDWYRINSNVPVDRYRLRRGTPTEWTVKNPVLMPGEQGLELVTGVIKIGDGITRWNDLPVYKRWEDIQAYVDAEIAGVVTETGGTAVVVKAGAMAFGRVFN